MNKEEIKLKNISKIKNLIKIKRIEVPLYDESIYNGMMELDYKKAWLLDLAMIIPFINSYLWLYYMFTRKREIYYKGIIDSKDKPIEKNKFRYDKGNYNKSDKLKGRNHFTGIVDFSNKPKNHYKHYTKSELNKLKYMIKKGYLIPYIAKKLNRTEPSIRNAIHRYLKNENLEIKRDNNNKNYFWKEEEIKYLKENYNKISAIKIAKILNKKTQSVYDKAYRMRLKRNS